MNITKKPFLYVLLLLIIIRSLLAINDNQKRQVIISFDDGYYSVYKYAYPTLKKYNVPITLALITSYLKEGQARTDASPYHFMNIAEVRQMIDALNIEIASHSITHRDLTKLNTEEAFQELKQSRMTLDSIFSNETTTFVYPYGHTNKKLIEMTRAAGYKLGRSTCWGDPNLWVEQYMIPIKEVRMTTTVNEILNHVNKHKTTVLLFHRILPNPRQFTEWGQGNFEKLIKQITKDPDVQLITMKQMYQQWWQEIFLKHIAQKGWLNNPILLQKIDIDQTRTFNTRPRQ